ncbi:diacylglycerol kinase [Nocardioidaceae bacterium]|nr:diacylglycerol kinase [Nocardioidaceae bacterium]
MVRYLVITNDTAGSDDDGHALRLALEVLTAAGEAQVVSTSSPEELDDVLADRDGRTIVIAGGDGSLHAVIDRLHARGELGDGPVGLLPLGTGNDFARGVGVPLEPDEAARLIVETEPTPVDVIVDDDSHVVVNAVHLGASAHASRKAADWKSRLGKVRLGIFGYPVGAAISALNPPILRLDVTVDGEQVADRSSHVLMVAVGNGPSVGGGNQVTPDADPEDGTLDVMVSHSIGRITRLAMVWDMVRRKHRTRRDVDYLEGREVTVAGDKFYISADGEISGPYTSRTWRLHRRAIPMHLDPDRDTGAGAGWGPRSPFSQLAHLRDD